MGKIYLDVPFREKDQAKSLGARWDRMQQRWFITAQLQKEDFRRWLPAAETIALPLDVDESAIQTCIRLSELLAPLRTLVQHTQSLWIQAEIESLKQTQQGHCYLNLVEHDTNKQKLATARANIWAPRAHDLLSKFANQTGYPLSENQQIRVKIAADLHPIYGFSLTIEDIDPAFTLGALAIKLQNIRKQLKAEGIYFNQKQFILPSDFFNIAVIAPSKSSAMADFQRISKPLQTACHFHFIPATFQGGNSISSLTESLQTVLKRHERTPIDACIIIRGGGSKGDLHYLNDYDLANIICNFPMPVLSGIGHETDITIIDEVCSARFSTPTKAAMFIRDSIAESCQEAVALWQTVRQQSTYHTQTHQQHLTRVFDNLSKHAYHLTLKQAQKLQSFQVLPIKIKQILNNQQQHFNHLYQTVTMSAKHHQRMVQHKHLNQYQYIGLQLSTILQTQAQQLTPVDSMLRHLCQILQQHNLSLSNLQLMIHQNHPERLLSKGYAIVQQESKVIKSVQQLDNTKPISIMFSNGSVSLESTTVNELM